MPRDGMWDPGLLTAVRSEWGWVARVPRRLGLPKHPDEHRPKDAVLLAVDQQLGEARLCE